MSIRVDGVYKSFKEQTVLTDVTHEFETGKVHGIVGNNGSGKTVLMKCVCGFLRPERGEIYVDGKRVGRDVDFPPDVGLIIETPGFLHNLSGFNNLKLLADVKGKVSPRTIRAALLRVGLDPAMKKKVGQYSLGMRQRLGIAQAIMEDPSVLILDEPFNGLDKKGVADMHRLVHELKAQGKTILLASHNQGDIDELCDRVCEMDGGVLSVVR